MNVDVDRGRPARPCFSNLDAMRTGTWYIALNDEYCHHTLSGLNTDDAPTHDARHPNSRPALELPGRRLFVSTVTLAHLSLAPLIHRERNGLG